jgi:ribosomal protein S6--L-glutamate ligase
MKIGILSRNAALYSTRRLLEAARLRGHQTVLIDAVQLALRLSPQGKSRWFNQAQLPAVDGLIPRVGSSVTAYGVAVVRKFEQAGAATTATAEAIAISRNKLDSLRLLQTHGLPTPRTELVTAVHELHPAITAVGGLPLVIKTLRGTQGRGVILVHNLETVEAIFTALANFHQPLLLQEYIGEAAGRDTRLLVVGRRVVAAMSRAAAAGEFRSNLHRGGTAVAMKPGRELCELAVRAAVVHNLSVAGVDIIESRRGPLLLELNSSPGLEGIETCSGIDVAGAIVRHLEEVRSRK